MSKPSTSLANLVDALSTIRHLNEAAFMAAGDGSLTTDATNAMQSLIHEIHLKLCDVETGLERHIDTLKGGAA